MLLSHRNYLVRQNGRQAFTLLEVLVVMAIIVMIAGVGGYYLLQRLDDSKISTARIKALGLSQQLDIYKTNNGEYPPSLEALTQPQPNGFAALVPPEELKDPWGNIYRFDPAGGHNRGQKADVFTTAPNGQMIGNWK